MSWSREVLLECDGGVGCHMVIAHRTLERCKKEARESGWRLLGAEALCPTCRARDKAEFLAKLSSESQ